MDFFARQEQSRRTSRYLVLVFFVAFAVVALATTAAVAAGLRLYMENHALFLGTQSWREWAAAHAALLFGIGAGTLGLMSIASLYRAATLARGGGQVARMLGAVQVMPDDTEPLRRRLHNIVEEMAIASGVPVPEVYVLEEESGINAFAAGLKHSDAAVAVTRGALERLERSELSGVIAHEFSHILNGDMRLNQQLIGLSFGILALSLCGRWLLRSARYGRRGRNSGGAAAALAIGVALTLIGAIGILLSRLIKAAVARHRERLADASAVQFTRDPEGLAGALKKIGGYTARVSSVDTEEVSHMLFAHGAASFRGWFATHPPLEERIRALDPAFDPARYAALTPAHAHAPAADPRTAAFAQAGPAADSRTAAFAQTAPVASADLLARAGSSESNAVGKALRAALPADLADAAHSRDSSFLLALAFGLAADEDARRRQLALLTSRIGTERAERCARLHVQVRRLPPPLRLPLIELALPALRQRPAEQIDFLLELLQRLGELDDARSLLDYVQLRVLTAQLRDLGRGRAPAGRGPPLPAALGTLLAHVAALGHADASAARAAYAAAWARMNVAIERAPPYEERTDFARLDAALERLAYEKMPAKRRVLVAVLAAIEHDGQVAPNEVELGRAVAITLGCPIPPIVALSDAAGGARSIR